jgi:hypothetical protein
MPGILRANERFPEVTPSVAMWHPTIYFLVITCLLYSSGVFFFYFFVVHSKLRLCAKLGQKLDVLEFGSVFRIFLCFCSKALSLFLIFL